MINHEMTSKYIKKKLKEIPQSWFWDDVRGKVSKEPRFLFLLGSNQMSFLHASEDHVGYRDFYPHVAVTSCPPFPHQDGIREGLVREDFCHHTLVMRPFSIPHHGVVEVTREVIMRHSYPSLPWTYQWRSTGELDSPSLPGDNEETHPLDVNKTLKRNLDFYPNLVLTRHPSPSSAGVMLVDAR